MKRDINKFICFAAVALLAAGCYQYPAPPASTLGDTYTKREKDDRDDMLKGITSLTRADAQRIAIKNNPSYIAAFHAVNAARMRYYQSLGAYSPVINAGFNLQDSHTWSTHNVNATTNNNGSRTQTFSTNTTVGASLLLFNGFARYFATQAAKHDVTNMEEQERDRCRTIMQAVAVAYNEVLLAIENRRIAEEDRKFQLSSLKDTEYKFNAGAVPLSDVLNFRILVNNAEVDMIAADYQYETAVYALAVLMGYPEGMLPPGLSFPSDFKSYYPELPAVEVYLDAALASRPDLKSYREQLEISRYQLYQTYSAYSPTVSAYANFGYGTGYSRYHHYKYYNDLQKIHHSYSASPSFSYGINADWTIFNGFIRYNTMREYQANLAIADYQVAALWFNVVGEVRAAHANYVQSVRQAKIRERNRKLAEEQRDLVDEEYRAGNTELTRLNEAQRDLVEAETSLAASYISIQNAKAQLDAAVGANSADYYMNLNNESKTLLPPGLETYQQGNTAAAPAPAEKTATAAPAKKAAVKSSAKKNAPAAAPAKSNAPAIPASATAAPPLKK